VIPTSRPHDNNDEGGKNVPSRISESRELNGVKLQEKNEEHEEVMDKESIEETETLEEKKVKESEQRFTSDLNAEQELQDTDLAEEENENETEHEPEHEPENEPKNDVNSKVKNESINKEIEVEGKEVENVDYNQKEQIKNAESNQAEAIEPEPQRTGLEYTTKEEIINSNNPLEGTIEPEPTGVENVIKPSISKHTIEVLDDLDLVEQELEEETKRLALAPTDGSIVDTPKSANDNAESIQGASAKRDHEKDEENKKEEDKEIKKEEEKEKKKEDIKEREQENTALQPVVPKSRPKLSDSNKEANETPQVPAQRPASQVSTDNLSVNKKAPPRVPKKPSSRIAQFQEMLEKQQKADLGLLHPQLAISRANVDLDVSKEDNNNSDGSNIKTVPKINKLQSNFAQSLNGMIGMGLPIAFGANPYEAIKQAKAKAIIDEKPESTIDEASEQKKVQANDIRRGRAKGPRGRKLPGEVKKTVEINNTTLGNTFSIIVKDLWSLDLNAPVIEGKLEEIKPSEDEDDQLFDADQMDEDETKNYKDFAIDTGLKEISKESEILDDVKEDNTKEAEIEQSIDDLSPVHDIDGFDFINKQDLPDLDTTEFPECDLERKPILSEVSADAELIDSSEFEIPETPTLAEIQQQLPKGEVTDNAEDSVEDDVEKIVKQEEEEEEE
jgi:hypothetical protein